MTLLSLIAMLALCPAVCLAQTQGNPDDEVAIKRVIAKSRESVEKADADLRAALYTENAVFYNAFGVEREGREAIREFWKAIFASGTFSKSTFKFTKEKIRFLTPDVAVVDIFEEVAGQRAPSTGKEVPTRNVHMTFIMMKKDKEWYFAYYRAGDLRTDSIR
ncbi:MAG TPA: SgcJ/EcaC family oxidoreductase [Candidatus Saccharimonadales bacterium]|nr:SgcJ/EcaC family oxidoreductase [Candidatus Saccharimonadales bacterium]